MKKLCILFTFLVAAFTQAQVMADPPDPMMLCDINSPGDDIEIFNLTASESQVINGQSNVNVSFHLTSGDALGGSNAIQNKTAYSNLVNPQLIFIRLQSTAGQGSDITTIELTVHPVPFAINPPEDLMVDDGNGDGFAEFDLTQNEAVMLDGQAQGDIVFTYYENEVDAFNATNPITTPTAYTNSSNPQTVFARIATAGNNCFNRVNFMLLADGILGVSEIDLDNMRMFPNPATSQVHVMSSILTSESVVSIYNIGGQRVLRKEYAAQENGVSFDVSLLKTGVYFVEVLSEANRTIKKLIKK